MTNPIFEITEIYADNDGSVVVSQEDSDAASQNIWGSPAPRPRIYLQMIQIDRDNDTLPDFIEEYWTLGGRRSTWDSDYDGEWNQRYTVVPREEGQPLEELTEFYLYSGGKKVPVSIRLVEGEPSEIKVDDSDVPVSKGKKKGFYWLYEAGTESQELNLLGQVSGLEQGVLVQVDDGDCFLQAVSIGQNLFARVVKKSDDVKKAEDENAREKERVSEGSSNEKK